LGFAYGDAPADEPYTITTAQVVVGLVELEEALPLEQRDRVHELAGEAVVWLTDGCPRLDIDGLSVPAYRPTNQRPIHNATAYWARALATAAGAGHEVDVDPIPVARMLFSRRLSRSPWNFAVAIG